MKTETCIYSRVFEYFCQMSSKSILIISSYTISNLVRFWDTVYSLIFTITNGGPIV